jgi:myo-inositol 2-dehydrogenase/D-chiro-inositol 1-dehydrogenase
MGIQRLRVGMAGLGRVGKFHAMNFLERTPRAELVAAFTPDANELAWGRLTLEPQGVTLYDNYEEMLKHPGLQAVVIGTATSVHADEAIKAIEQDLHVLCEKPLSIDIEVVNANIGEHARHFRLPYHTVQSCCGSG